MGDCADHGKPCGERTVIVELDQDAGHLLVGNLESELAQRDDLRLHPSCECHALAHRLLRFRIVDRPDELFRLLARRSIVDAIPVVSPSRIGGATSERTR